MKLNAVKARKNYGPVHGAKRFGRAKTMVVPGRLRLALIEHQDNQSHLKRLDSTTATISLIDSITQGEGIVCPASLRHSALSEIHHPPLKSSSAICCMGNMVCGTEFLLLDLRSGR